MELYLDGVRFFNKTLAKYEKGDASWLKREVWSRLTIPIQTVLHLVEMVVMQVLRGIASLLSGLLTFDGKKIQNGAIDLVSVVVQLVMITALGIVGFFMPKIARNWSDMSKHEVEEKTSSTCRAVRFEITGIIRGILALPIGVVDGVTLGISGVLTADGKRIREAVHHFVIGLISPILGLATGFDEWSRNKVWNIHWMKPA